MSGTITYYKNINPSQHTISKRSQIKSLQDEFTTFSWRGYDAFENFGAFIINDKKGSLKFYNGPGFTNEYTKPQFQPHGGLLQGVNFNKQSISFTIGVYWFDIKEYRLLLDWLNPLEIDILSFGFSSLYGYSVKLSKISDSTRWVVGKENGEPKYYTELNLNFEVQGENCARGLHPYEFGWKDSVVDTLGVYQQPARLITTDPQTFIQSDLDVPLSVGFYIDPVVIFANKFDDSTWTNSFYSTLDGTNVNMVYSGSFEGDDNLRLNEYPDNPIVEIDVELTANYFDYTNNSKHSISLCGFTLQNLTLTEKPNFKYHFQYNSETGLVFVRYGDGSEKLLTLQTFTDTGEFLIKTFNTSKFVLPGLFTYPQFSMNGFFLQLKWNQRFFDGKEWVTWTMTEGVKQPPVNFEDKIYTKADIICYPRTNVI